MAKKKHTTNIIIDQFDIRSDGDMVNLNDLYVAAGSPANKKPYDWIRLNSTKNLIEKTCELLQVDRILLCKSSKARVDRGGGTWASKELSIKYYDYLNKDNYSDCLKAGLYALKFSNGIIKVGKSMDVEERVKTHESNAKAYGLFVIDRFLVQDTDITEKELIAYCRGLINLVGENHHGEYFIDLDFDKIKKFLGWIPPRKKAKSKNTNNGRIYG